MLTVPPTHCATLLAALLAVIGVPAQAEELQFDISGTALSADGQTAVGPWDITFKLDTLSGTQQLTFNSDGSLFGYNVSNAAFSDVDLSINGQTAIAAVPSLLGVYSGGELQFGGMQFSVDGSTFTWEYGGHLGPGPFSGSDPLAAMFLSSHPISEAAFQSVAGSINLDAEHVSVHAIGVPEPETLGLMIFGIAGVVLYGRNRAKTNIRSFPASNA